MKKCPRCGFEPEPIEGRNHRKLRLEQAIKKHFGKFGRLGFSQEEKLDVLVSSLLAEGIYSRKTYRKDIEHSLKKVAMEIYGWGGVWSGTY